MNELRRETNANVLSDIKGLQGVLTANLQRAIRDNDIIYVSPVPAAAQLPVIAPAAMIKANVPGPVEQSLEWVMGQAGGALFSGLVPYGVHLALSES